MMTKNPVTILSSKAPSENSTGPIPKKASSMNKRRNTTFTIHFNEYHLCLFHTFYVSLGVGDTIVLKKMTALSI